MRGLPFCGFPAFDAARDKFKAMGYNVISPADMDRDHGFDAMTDPLPEGAALAELARECIRRDVAAILDGYGDAPPPTHIALLPGWLESKGAGVEHALAHFLGLEVIPL
jgi:hypothetical protein